MERYQVVVIGGGAAGMTVASGVANLGAKTALIEKGDSLGGDCLHYGCVPSKALIDAANRIHTMHGAADTFGYKVSGELNFSAVTSHIKSAQAVIQEHDNTERFENLGVDVFFGAASFESPHEIRIGSRTTIYAEKVVIATGSAPVVPPIPGLDSVPYVTNETVFDLPELPKRLGVIGGGTIGLEMAQAFSRLGSEVTVFEGLGQIFGKEDEDIAKFMYNELKQEFTIKLNTKVKSLSSSGEGVAITVENGVTGIEETHTVDTVLLSVGRKPNTGSLNLAAAGVEVVRGFVDVDDTFRSTQSHIFAVGDTVATLPFTHAAGEEAKTVVSNVLFGLRNKLNHDTTPWVTFTSPEVFHVGKTEEEAKQAYGENGYRVYRAHLDEVDRFITAHETRGFVKIVTDKSGTIIGAHAAGKEAGEWMQLVVFAMKNKKKVGALSRIVYPYPTKAGALQRAADVYWRETLFDGPLPKIAKKFFEWKYKWTAREHDAPQAPTDFSPKEREV